MLSRNCPICEKSDASELFSEANYDSEKLNEYSFASRKTPEYMHHKLMKCKMCNILYSTDIPKENKIIDAYEEASFDSSKEAELASRTYIKYLKSINLQNKEMAIDIGTGEGSFLKKLVGIGFERVVGIEPSKAPIMQADESIREFIINDMFIPENFQENSIDLISCFQTLEHIYAPSQIVEGIFKLLKKEGMIYIVSHSYEALTTKILKKKSPIFDIEHLQLFSPKGLKLMLENNGFKDIRIFKIKNKYPLSYLVKLFPFPKGLKCILLDFLNKTNIGNVEISLNIGNIGAIAKK